ncbi:MAG TPA: ATP-binding cassette domain-containing protein [Ktedonobacteraceae bacterium]
MPAIQPDTPAIEVEQLVKRFGRVPRNAVDGISFSVQRGEIFGLLGPNGAGKTTTIGILTTSVLPSSGRATLAGIDVVADPIGVKQRIAVVPQRVNLDQSLRVRDILVLHGAYHGLPRATRNTRADALLAELGLTERAQERIMRYSGGLGQRVMLARALMHEPEVLFLDEPTNNLDPQSRLFLWDRIRSLHELGITIVLTTHDMEEADRLCERIAIMDHGRILALDTPERLKRLIPGGTMLELRVRTPELVPALHASKNGNEQAGWQNEGFSDALRRLPGVTKVEYLAGRTNEGDEQKAHVYRLYATEEADELVVNATQVVAQEQGKLLDLHFTHPSLEDVFIYLTGRDLRS